MYDLDLVKVNRSLVKAIRVAAATRRMIGKGRDGYIAILEVEGEIRTAAEECQRVLALAEADADRPLIR